MRKFVSISVLAAVIIFWFVFAIHNSLAAPADFDPTFGANGKVVASMTAGGPAQINKIVIQPDGKILAAGWAQDNDSSLRRFALARFLPDGSLDPTFGNGGKVFTTLSDGNSEANDLVIQPNGRIIAVGALFGPTRYSTVVMRYNSSGSLDSSFSVDGIVVFNYDSVASDIATSVALQTDGKIVVAGPALTSILGPTCSYHISRLNSTGGLDTTFNGNGKRLSEFGLLTTGHVKIGLQPDGKIIATGPGGDGTHFDFAIQRFNSNGGPDAFFGNGGRVYTNFNGSDVPKTLTMLADGRFIVGGSSETEDADALMLVRYMPNGTKDSTFGFGGYVVQDITAGVDLVESIVVQPNGKTVVVGRATGSGLTNQDFLVARYQVNGLADSTFGIDGVKRFTYGSGDDHAYSVALQSNGRIVAAGAAEVQSTTATSFVLARLLGRGTTGDYDNDGLSDVSVFRPSDGTWYLNRSDDGYIEYPFGTTTDRSLVGDFDGDGRSDIAVFRPSNGRWYVFRSTAGYVTVHFGMQGDIPVTGDFDGDDKTDVAVFRPSTGIWYCLKSSSGFSSSFAQQFGLTGDKPVPGDYDRDGRADLAVYRPSDSVWYILGSTRGFYAARFGLSTDVPAPADFDGDSAQDIAVYRPSDGVWHLLRSSDGAYQPVRFGLPGDIPQPGDFDLDGRSDIAVFRPSDGVWHILRSSDGGYRATAWGLNGDRPAVVTSVD